jgi:hypothetical protein
MLMLDLQSKGNAVHSVASWCLANLERNPDPVTEEKRIREVTAIAYVGK